MIRDITTQLTSSKIAENLISCRSHRVDIQKLIPSTIPIKTSITDWQYYINTIIIFSLSKHPPQPVLLQHNTCTNPKIIHKYMYIYIYMHAYDKLKKERINYYSISNTSIPHLCLCFLSSFLDASFWFLASLVWGLEV